MRFATKAIHIGYQPDPITGSIMPPIYMTSTFAQNEPGEGIGGYDYTRAGNPNFTILEELLSSLENARYATVFSSGLGALSGLGTTLSQGDKVLGIDGLYGGTYRLFTQVFNRFGIEFKTVPYGSLEKALEEKPKWLIFETPTNPLLGIYDMESIIKAAKKQGTLVIVDNTFATPYFQNPLYWGADLVWHSSTKYIGGHSDVIGGVIMTNLEEYKKALDFSRKALGVNPSPFDTWLLTRGVKTLALRMEQHQKNALAVAQYLEKHPKVSKVYYPGLSSHPGHEIAKKQMFGYGGMVSAEFHLTLEETKKLISSFKFFNLAESLGGVESLVTHPATMTHASIPKEERDRIGLKDGLIRFSIGIEDVEDLIEDLNQALL